MFCAIEAFEIIIKTAKQIVPFMNLPIFDLIIMFMTVLFNNLSKFVSKRNLLSVCHFDSDSVF